MIGRIKIQILVSEKIKNIQVFLFSFSFQILHEEITGFLLSSYLPSETFQPKLCAY